MAEGDDLSAIIAELGPDEARVLTLLARRLLEGAARLRCARHCARPPRLPARARHGDR
jgi:hypothetical protein